MRQAQEVEQGLQFLDTNGSPQAAASIGSLMAQNPAAIEALLSGVGDVVDVGTASIGLTQEI